MEINNLKNGSNNTSHINYQIVSNDTKKIQESHINTSISNCVNFSKNHLQTKDRGHLSPSSLSPIVT